MHLKKQNMLLTEKIFFKYLYMKFKNDYEIKFYIIDTKNVFIFLRNVIFFFFYFSQQFLKIIIIIKECVLKICIIY